MLIRRVKVFGSREFANLIISIGTKDFSQCNVTVTDLEKAEDSLHLGNTTNLVEKKVQCQRVGNRKSEGHLTSNTQMCP
jgi:hypothetical protein